MTTDFNGLTVIPLDSDSNTPMPLDGSKGVCPDCQKTLTITAAGALRQHKCVGDEPAKKKVGKRVGAPASVRKLGIAAVASGVEWTTAQTVARYVPCDPATVPADMGDNADVMIGPFIDLLWPSIPKSAQKLIKQISDETDLIVALMAWAEWARVLRAWAKEAHENAAQKTPTLRRVDNDGTVSAPTDSGYGLGGLAPFVPVTPSTAAL